ncbi:TonB-dependent receptor domain-containing protein [Endozoicomonas numazuensis]|uniref:TonB-dependent receptor domain-containing protein n=1 Tax=Endozoicomonas numazuensis TaxID=1137799 RepID=UPI00068B49C8|nr:TonB-dependent receptor [Endozoicomonas numazuensis]
MSHKLHIAVALATASLAGTIQANEATELEEVVVTASRTAQSVDEALAPVTVITREDIERSQATSVPELLSKTPSMQISTYGGAGSLPNVYLRGTSTPQTLVLIDGMKVNAPSSGSAPLQYIDPSQIERIEIVRGPRSSLYGADAIGGVIQIFTRKGTQKPKLSLKVGTGSRNTGEYGINFSGSSTDVRYNLGANLYETGGYDNTLELKDGDGDKDAYRNKSVFGSVSKHFSNGLEVGGAFSHAEGKSEYDNNYPAVDYTTQPYNIFRIANASVYTSIPVTEAWSTRVDAGYMEELSRGNVIDNSTGESSDDYFSNNKRYSISWKNDIAWHESQYLIAGVDYSKDQYDGSTDYKDDSRDNTGVFVQNTSYLGNSDLELSLRNDKNEAYGSNTTGGASLGYDIASELRLILSYGKAFRAPTLSDLYYPFGGNSKLKPEKSENYEAALKGKLADYNWGLSAFQNNMDDMIIYDTNVNQSQNVEKARIRGVEFTIQTQTLGWDLNSSLSLLDPENRTATDKGKVLIYRAKQLFRLDVDKQFNRLGLGATFRAQGKSYKDAANQVEVAGFGTVDLRMSVDVAPELKAGLKVVNLFDKEYQAVYGYRGEPSGVFVTFTWTPEI